MKKADKIRAARVQKAITGLQIPLMRLNDLGKMLDRLIAEGASDSNLQEAAADFVRNL